MDPQTIKQKAISVFNEYNPNGLVPFPFAEMASRLGNVDLLFSDSITPNISGVIYFQTERFTILINQQKSAVRQYFTTAHEFGHYFLHDDWLQANASNGFIDFSETLDGDTMLLRHDELSLSQVDVQKEREANNFAAELIMPEDKVREFWSLTHDITECANAFQVSKSAMAVRLERLQLV
jgi:Zn-dependent peptidase ImmA (M78 family)